MSIDERLLAGSFEDRQRSGSSGSSTKPLSNSSEMKSETQLSAEEMYKQFQTGNVQTILSFLENKSKNKYFHIVVRLGDNKGKLRVRLNREIDSFEFEDAIELSIEQMSFLRFNGMKHIASGEVFPMVSHKVIPDTTFLEKRFVNRLREGDEYLLLTKDTREDIVRLLTKEQLDHIQEKFNRIDENGTGIVSTADVRKYFVKIRENKIANYTAFAMDKIKKEPLKESYHKTQLQTRIDMATKQCQKNIDYFMKIDIDNNGDVSFEEFRNNEAKLYLSSKGAYSL